MENKKIITSEIKDNISENETKASEINITVAKDAYVKKMNSSRNKHNQKSKYYKRPLRSKDAIKAAFSNNDASAQFKKVIHEYSHGRHILDLSPLDIYELRNGIFARKRALVNIVKVDPELSVHIQELSNRLTYEISDYAYEELYKGLTKTLESLSLNCYVSPEKVINAGNAIKNHDGAMTYGGKTIRNYLTHIIKNEKITNISDEDAEKCINIVKTCRHSFADYNAIKSLPFSVFRYKQYIRTNENGEITTPDIEAKYNIRRMIGPENYNAAPFAKISITDATTLESKLIEKIRKTAQNEADIKMNELVVLVKDDTLKKHLIMASNLDNVSVITNHGHVHDIIDYMVENTNTIIKLQEKPNDKISPEDANKIIRIEYAAAQGNYDTDITKDILWISDLGECLKGQYATYEIIRRVISLGFVPTIAGDVITRTNINLLEFDAIIDSSKDMSLEDRITYINDMLKNLYF